MKDGKFLAIPTSEGNINFFKWDWFGDIKDRFPLKKCGLNTIVKLSEN